MLMVKKSSSTFAIQIWYVRGASKEFTLVAQLVRLFKVLGRFITCLCVYMCLMILFRCVFVNVCVCVCVCATACLHTCEKGERERGKGGGGGGGEREREKLNSASFPLLVVI